MIIFHVCIQAGISSVQVIPRNAEFDLKIDNIGGHI
jgi:hypothetical protein